ncbi:MULTISPECIES: hypothetical protein [unclassified Pantoea]|uniref:hypothetical protein n=1 Tax=unclassified Pantoea TaxID=2630326 RepID=UPI001231B710|nr:MULTISPECIES: hypothetical protein [unclassified Pantoea]KAA6096663.1 hypothetical protein F3I21_19300 [Pantoea sp. B_9]KAA6114301.1 hypothetical protein F3I18_09975 [Pantoea sp. B_10]
MDQNIKKLFDYISAVNDAGESCRHDVYALSVFSVAVFSVLEPAQKVKIIDSLHAQLNSYRQGSKEYQDAEAKTQSALLNILRALGAEPKSQ